MSRFLKSLRFRLLIILSIVGIVPALIVGRTVISAYEDRAVSLRTAAVEKECRMVSTMLIQENFIEDQTNTEAGKRLEMLANFFEGRIVITDRDYRIVMDTYHADEGQYLVSPMVVACLKNEETHTSYRPEDRMISLAVPVMSPDVNGPQGTMLVTVSSGSVNLIADELSQRGLIILWIVCAVVLFAAYMLSTVLVKPFARITRSIENIDSYQGKEVRVTDYTETVLISEAFSRLLARMRLLDESRDEFVSNVSHELKTPMTSMKVLADSLVGQENVPEELYQEFLSDITVEIDRENKVISDLLEIVRLDRRAKNIQIQHMDIRPVLENILRRLRPIADERHIDLILECFRNVEADVDELKFMSAVSNLVENAIKYNVDDGWVRVTLDADHQAFWVIVADSGMGIPPESIEHIFERFYRVDKSHSREIGGTGLGLAITRSAIGIMHGTIEVQSREGEGTRFTVRIPLSYIAKEESL